ncbi:DUF6879 family protein [Streptosporangium subroseum]|uniref:DUF6879 family protein n=1 Tax=Streptosporangium subroseum TaxID=106412 RepID=UPI00308EA73F|nr:hypothetical protein OHB15_13980 [Streptosporangium subroseum]
MLASAQREAVHLEMRDTYTPDDPCYVEWQKSRIIDVDTHWQEWRDEVRNTVARGVAIRRARIVSQPVTEFIRYEYELTSPLNVAAGEQVRWLPRDQASGLTLPGNDFWVFDDHLVRFTFFAGNGEYVGEELATDPALIKLCTTAFEAVWQQGIDHSKYQLD